MNAGVETNSQHGDFKEKALDCCWHINWNCMSSAGHTEPSCPHWVCGCIVDKMTAFPDQYWKKSHLYVAVAIITDYSETGQSPSPCSHNVVHLPGWCYTVKHSHKKESKRKRVGQRWLMGRIDVEREKHTRGLAAGPALDPGRRETRGRRSGF